MERQNHTINAAGMSIGRLSTVIAGLLMGKNKTAYQPHIDGGDFVTVKNLKQAKFTGKKLTQKNYYHFTGYIGNYKEIPMRRLWEEKPQLVLRASVLRMLPKNKLRNRMIKRLTIKQ